MQESDKARELLEAIGGQYEKFLIAEKRYSAMPSMNNRQLLEIYRQNLVRIKRELAEQRASENSEVTI